MHQFCHSTDSDSSCQRRGTNLLFEDEMHLNESEGVDLGKDIYTCFVLLDVCVLDFY